MTGKQYFRQLLVVVHLLGTLPPGAVVDPFRLGCWPVLAYLRDIQNRIQAPPTLRDDRDAPNNRRMASVAFACANAIPLSGSDGEKSGMTR